MFYQQLALLDIYLQHETCMPTCCAACQGTVMSSLAIFALCCTVYPKACRTLMYVLQDLNSSEHFGGQS